MCKKITGEPTANNGNLVMPEISKMAFNMNTKCIIELFDNVNFIKTSAHLRD